MASSISDSLTLTSVQTRKAVLKAFKSKRPVFLWGPPGIGKSDVVSSVASELGGACLDLRMSQMEPTDIRGIPFFNKDTGKMDWAPPVDLPDEEFASQYPIVVLFLDEMNSAPPAVQAAAYQLVLNRRVGKYHLPSNVVVIAAGNRDSDKGVTYRMPSALANRFIHLEMRADFTSWQTWAVNNGVHKDVVGYLSFAKHDIFDFDSKSSSRAYPTPRSWCFVSDLLNDPDTENDDPDTMYNLIAGSIGEGLAVKFAAHRKTSGKLPQPADILSGAVTTLEFKEISSMYALVVALNYELKDALENKRVTQQQFYDMANNFFTYMMDNMEVELVVMGARIALNTYKLPINPTQIKSFDRFYAKYGKYFSEIR